MTQTEHIYAIFSRPEVAGEAISGGHVKTIEGYFVLHFESASVSSFRADQNQPFV